MFRPCNDMRTLIVLFVLVPFVRQLGVKMWVYLTKIKCTMFDRNKHMVNVPAVYRWGGNRNLLCSSCVRRGFHMPPGSLGSWFNYRFNKSCFSAFGFLYTSWYMDHSTQCCVLGHSSSSKLVEPSGFTVWLHPEPSHGSRLSRGETRRRREKIFSKLLFSKVTLTIFTRGHSQTHKTQFFSKNTESA